LWTGGFEIICRTLIASIILALTACAPGADAPKVTPYAHPFVGCWQSEDGLAIEGWTEDPSGWLFGYAVNRDDNNDVKFFEQMRLTGDGLVVIGPNDDAVKFELIQSGPKWIFENAAHDYPQRITYMPSPGRLDAEISLLDGGQKMDFKKQACE